ncbi:MAG: hypothetical protein U9N31_00325 [Candidatus Marinimicrobia bacterium]|nr:hypothetical protein [Candidatus Neomarinimicrobiota bacterium]
MKKIILLCMFNGLLLAETKSWDTHSAYLLPQKRWEVGLFQPFRFGHSEMIEYSTFPLWFFVMPNVSIKRIESDMAGFNRASRFKLVYPTPLLNMLARTGIGEMKDPNFQMPPMLGLSASWLMSKPMAGLDLTLKGGLDLRLLPGLADVQINPDLAKLMGDYPLEHKLLLIWNKSDRFRIMTGYKFVKGTYPYGSDMRLLPYIPMMEKWVPIIELQWTGKKAK